MADSRKRVLDMLSEGKISVDEAERLLSVVDKPAEEPAESEAPGSGRRQPPKYLHVLVESDDADSTGERVNVRVPLTLIRAGMKLPALIPSGVADKVNAALKDNGIEMDVRDIKGNDLDELVNAITELEVDVQDGPDKVRLYFE